MPRKYNSAWPLVSVLMPIYNANDTLFASLASIVDQEYTNWEAILVDDGSVHDSTEVISLLKDKRIKYFKFQENRGLSACLNSAIEFSSGRFLARMDADDIMEPWRLGDQVRYMIEKRLSILGTAAQRFGGQEGLMVQPLKGPQIMDSFLINNPFIHPTVMFDREKLQGELRYDESFRCEEDYELWARLLNRDNCENIEYSTLKYRVSMNSNANHPLKKRLNLLVLERFAERFGILGIAPIRVISELQIGGVVDEPGYRMLRTYAETAALKSLPGLGWIQKKILNSSNYGDFMGWFVHRKRATRYRY